MSDQRAKYDKNVITNMARELGLYKPNQSMLRDCLRCNYSLPSTFFWSVYSERLHKFIRDSICIGCRNKAGETQDLIVGKIQRAIESGHKGEFVIM